MNFGVECKGSPLSHLYYVGLKQPYPNSIEPSAFTAVFPIVAPFFGLQPGLYWTSDSNTGGQVTYSFNTGLQGANTTTYNLFHVLPMTQDKLGTTQSGTGVLLYISGPGAGKAVYDSHTRTSWPLYANLAAFDNFGVTKTTNITVNGLKVTRPWIDPFGDVYFDAVTTWITAMNNNNYAGSKNWMPPSEADLQTLHDDLGLQPGDIRFEDPVIPIPFFTLQPGFYWACVSVPPPNENAPAPCDPNANAGTSPGADPISMEYSFNFDDGFLGTDQNTKQFYVMVYYPAPAP